MSRLALSLALALALYACQDPPAPPPSVGDEGRPAAEPTPKAPEPAPEPAPVPEAPPKVALPSPDPARLEFVPDPTFAQIELLNTAKQAIASGADPTAAYEALLKTEPLSGARISAAIALADLKRSKGQPAEALALLEDLYRKAPPLPEIAFVLGRTYKDSSRLEAAILAFEEALRLQPLLLTAHVEIGGLLSQLGHAERSAAAFLEYERAIYRYAKLLEAQDTHLDDKLKITEAFSFLPDDRAALALVDALDDPEVTVRDAVVRALAEVGTDSTLPALHAAADKHADDPYLLASIRAAIDGIKKTRQEHDPNLGPAFIPTPAPADKATPKADEPPPTPP